MDKEWMSKHRLSREYEDGVESFLQFALQNCLDSNQIPCPCAKCGNLKRKNVITVRAHLCCHGMDLTYHTWIFHGEKSKLATIVDERDDMFGGDQYQEEKDQHQEEEDHVDIVDDAYETCQDNPTQFKKILEFSIHLEDILPFCELEPILGNCIILYIWHLYGVLKSKKMTSVCQFIQPFGVSHVPKAPLDERTRALFQGLERVSPSELAIVPCNVGHHWILTIIDPHKEAISLLDPLSHRNRDSSWKEVVNKAITMFNAKIGRRGKKQPNWEIIKAPIQPDSVQCGFFVMRYMKEIIEELANNGSISLRSVFDHRKYSQDEIDEVRVEWANCVLHHV